MSLPPIRAPREDGAILELPPLADAGNLLTANRRGFDESWRERRAQARRETLAAALQYLREAHEPLPEIRGESLLLAGHQPELFHPGVWVKNFAINGLARRHGLVPLNLIIDTDTAKSSTLHLPALAVDERHDIAVASADDPLAPLPSLGQISAIAHLASVAFDTWSGDVPYEERRVLDEAIFLAFPERFRDLTRGWNFEPLLPAFWDEVGRQAKRTSLLGERFAAARRAFERRWGCANLEVPMSRLCATASFADFAGHILRRLHEFHTVHNDALRDYRRRYGIDSRNRPVADLQREADWLEAPFWAWKAPSAKRQRLFVRETAAGFEVRAGAERWPTLPHDAGALIAVWRDLAADGFKVRSRALTTTMFARLFVSDLFVHGIGGAKYDELNDDIIRRFYGIEPPQFMILSGTLLLPLPRFPIAADAVQRLGHKRRDLWYNPERHVHDGQLPTVLLEEKRRWLQRRHAAKAERQARYRALREITHHLRERVAGQQEQAARELAQARQESEARAILERRDYAFCLHPEVTIKPFCQQFLDH